jgi:hypothetical protein
VKKTLQARNMDECIFNHDHTSSSGPEGSTDEYMSTSEEDVDSSGAVNSVLMERRLFVCESSQLMDLVNQINETSRCATIDCNGKFPITTFLFLCS